MIDYSSFFSNLRHYGLDQHEALFREAVSLGLNPQRYGDLPLWYRAFNNLPSLRAPSWQFDARVRIGEAGDISAVQQSEMRENLEALIPWRKGPYSLYGIDLDTEWRSDWKWDRVSPHIRPLQNKKVLDVGCGNGYHMWRMYGAGARWVLGIDPSPRFVVQFYMLCKLLGHPVPIDLLPMPLEDLPTNMACFDTCFSMGVLYHRPSPMDHLKLLRETLVEDGELILETLVIEGKLGEVLVPEGRYAKMPNVWFLPSVPTLCSWLRKCSFRDVRCVDVNQTSTEEQRSTAWMHFHSLAQFLDDSEPSKTAEGYPAPLRAIIVASKEGT